MVFLRLSIKVFPREQLSTNSSSGWGMSLLGARKSAADDSSQGSAASAILKKPGVFLLVLEKPEEVSLGGLAGMIQEHWAKLHPELEPLAIKKILDDTKDELDLHPDLTVADVWVDYGKARADGLDQRGSVRVLQKPSAAAPERFPSVDQDWDAAIAAYEHKRALQSKREAMERQFPAIQEEDEQSTNGASRRSASRSLIQSQNEWTQSPDLRQPIVNHVTGPVQKSPIEHRHRDLPLSSVEVRSPIATSPPAQSTGRIIAGTPPLRRESEELGESPSPAERRTSFARPPRTAGSMTAPSPKSQTKSQASVKAPIATTIATRTITQMPSEAESSPNATTPQTQSTEAITSSESEESESEPVPLPTQTRIPNGQGHLQKVAKSVSSASHKKLSEPAVLSSSEESSEEESGDELEDSEQKKALVQDEADDETDSDDSESDSDSESEPDSSDEQAPDDEIKPSDIGETPNEVESEHVDADGDLQMEQYTADNTSQSRKRKQSPGHVIPAKKARHETSRPLARQLSKSTSPKFVPEVVVSSQPSPGSTSKSPVAASITTSHPGPMSPQRRRERPPSFSSPGRRASIIHDETAINKPPQSGLGLGITRSPPSKQPVMLDLSQESIQTADLPATQSSFGGPLIPSSNPTVPESSFTSTNKQTPAIERTKKSAIRTKDSPVSERRSVSFADGDHLASTLDPVATSTPRLATTASKVKSSQQTPTPAARSTQTTPRNNATPKTAAKKQTPKSTKSTSEPTPTSGASDMVYPPEFDIVKIQREVAEDRERRQRESLTKIQRQVAEDQEKRQRETEAANEQQAKKATKDAEIAQQKQKEKAEKADIDRKLTETTDPHLRRLLTSMSSKLGRLVACKIEVSKRGHVRDDLEGLRQDVKAYEQKLEAHKALPPAPVVKQARPTLKDMLSSQKQELAAKTSKPRVEAKQAPARDDVYEVPSSSESESESESESDSDSDSDSSDDGSDHEKASRNRTSDGSDSESDSGDIMPDGSSAKLRKPRSQRSS